MKLKWKKLPLWKDGDDPLEMHLCDGDYRAHGLAQWTVTIYDRIFFVCPRHKGWMHLGSEHWRKTAKKDWKDFHRAIKKNKVRYPRLKMAMQERAQRLVLQTKGNRAIKDRELLGIFQEWCRLLQRNHENGRVMRNFMDLVGHSA